MLASDKFPVTNLGIEGGLSNNAVRCIYQDKKGFMWFGTIDGLNRYDGHGFKIFRNKTKNTNSLVYNIVSAITEDKSNYLWIGTRQGVSRYDDITGKFNTVTYKNDAGKVQEFSAVVRGIKTGTGNNIFIGTEGLGLLMCSGGNTIAGQIPLSLNKKSEKNYGVHAIEIDDQNRVWILIQNHGLGLYDSTAGVVRLVNSSVPAAVCVTADKGKLWIGAASAVYEYHIATNLMVKSLDDHSGGNAPGSPISLLLDKNHKLWIGTFDNGINIWDNDTRKMEHLEPGNDKYSLSEGAVYAIYEDNAARKWVGTLRGGVDLIDPQKNRFHGIMRESSNPKSLSGNVIAAFYEAPNGKLWVGTDGNGLNLWDRNTNVFTRYSHQPTESNSLSSDFITAIASDSTHNIWVGSFTGGIDRFNSVTHQFKHYPCINPVSQKENKVIFDLFYDSNNQLWATALRQTGIYGALYLYNKQADKFESFDTELSDLFKLNEDKAGNLWGGNLSQLVKIDRIHKKHQFFPIGYSVRSMHEDKSGNFWLGTEGGGLLLFDRKKNIVTAQYTTDNGLCNNVVLNILEDASGNLWMSTYNGLSKFNVAGKTFTNYDEGDGLQNKQFYFNAALELRSGEMAFGSIKGFTLFDPHAIGQSDRMPGLQLTDIFVNNAGIEENNSYITGLTRERIESLRVPFNAAVFSFKFTALEYSSPNKIAYAYFMDGWDRKWNYAGNERTANYTHINEGTYTLRIKATNAEGVWNPSEIALKLIVLPPWYRTWWAYSLYTSIMLSLVYFFYTYKIRQTRLQYQLNIAHLNHEKEQAELNRERAEHDKERLLNEKEKEINEKRLSFFTDISHEFRTPLTLIINPIKDILRKNEVDKRDDNHELNIVQRNAKRLLSLLDQLLLFRKAESGADTLKPSRINFHTLCRDVYLCFVQQAKSKNIEYVFESINEELIIFADREKMEIILFNLISNALKYTGEGGKVVFSIHEQEDTLVINVEDNGYGIPAETGEKLFDKFYRAQDHRTSYKPGFGIGLYLAKHFTEAHDGAIHYRSQQGKGTCFTLSFPKIKLQSPEQIFSESNYGEPVFLEELKGDHANEDEIVKGESQIALKDLVSEKQSMLVVDDDRQMRAYIMSMFKDKFTLHEAGSGEEGMKVALGFEPDIIISDVKMEGLSGIDLCKAIKTHPSLNHIPVVLLTGTSSADTKLEGVKGGADDYITKPFEKELLVARISNLLKSRTNLQKYFFNEVTLNKNNFKISADYKEFLERCIVIVEKHLDDDEFTIKQLSLEIGMSHSTVYRKIRLISGQSVNGFIRFIRLRKAAELFINTNYNINQVGFEVGMHDVKYFREQFNKLFGLNPSEYIKKFRKPFENQYSVDQNNF